MPTMAPEGTHASRCAGATAQTSGCILHLSRSLDRMMIGHLSGEPDPRQQARAEAAAPGRGSGCGAAAIRQLERSPGIAAAVDAGIGPVKIPQPVPPGDHAYSGTDLGRQAAAAALRRDLCGDCAQCAHRLAQPALPPIATVVFEVASIGEVLQQASSRCDPASWPGVQANRAFLARAVRYLAAQGGISQFLDIGAGLSSARYIVTAPDPVAGVPAGRAGAVGRARSRGVWFGSDLPGDFARHGEHQKPCQPRHRARRAPDRRSFMNTATTKTRSPEGPSTPSVRDDEGRARKDRGRKRSRLFMPLRWFRGKLSSAVGWVRAQVGSSARLIRSLLPRAVGWLRAQIKSPARLIKSLFMPTIGKDRGFGFWWLVVTVAIGLLVAVLLSPVIGILAALIVGIWMLVSRSRSSQSRKTVSA